MGACLGAGWVLASRPYRRWYVFCIDNEAIRAFNSPGAAGAGIWPHQFLIKRRISAAVQLLSQESLPVTEVCRLEGYHDLASFSKLFTKINITNPSNYARVNSSKLD